MKIEFEANRRDFLIGAGGLLTGYGTNEAISRITSSNSENSNQQFQPEPPSETSSDKRPTPTPETEMPTEERPPLTLSERITAGEENGPLNIVYWADYQCPFCYQFEQEAYTQLEANYISTGELQFTYKLLGIFGQDSRRATNASYAVYENNSEEVFWRWHSRLFEIAGNNERNTNWATAENLQPVIEEDFPEIEFSTVQTAIEDRTYSSRMSTDISEGDSWGLEGTPYFLFYQNSPDSNTQTLSGAQPYPRFVSTLESV